MMTADRYETWMVAVHPETGVRVPEIIAIAYRAHLPVRIKETCFGLLVESDRTIVRAFLGDLKVRFTDKLFIKRRGYSIIDTHVCRKTFTSGPGGDEQLSWVQRAVTGLMNSS